MKSVIELRNLTKTKISKKLLEKAAEEVFAKAGVKRLNPFTEGLSLSVVLAGPKRAQELNRTYRKKSYIPNVLSFDYGEIVLCPAKIRQDAAKYGILFEQELVRVFTHGLFHLLGYNHKQIDRLAQ